MPNLYIRLPISRCQYFRHRDANNPLKCNEPICFSEYTEEHYILRNSIYNNALTNNVDPRFFSQQEWKNMLRGKDPLGRKSIMTRNPNEWLRYEEIVSLLGRKPTDKTNLFDYLCIKLPNEVFCIDNVRSVTPSWTIDKNGYLMLYNLMNNDFKRSVIEWVLTTFDYCTSNGRIVLRGQNALMERFLIRYDIYPSEAEKSNLRRVIDRWLHEENINFNSYYSLDMKYHDEKEKRTPIQGIEFI